MTGDRQLRALAELHKIEVHGVLRLVDELHRHSLVEVSALVTALRTLVQDECVRLPRREITAAIRRYEAAE